MTNIIYINDYEIFLNKLLGEGSFSKVYLGTYKGQNKKHIKNGTIVAIKLLNNPQNPKIKQRIEDELKIMEIIKQSPNQNIVGCYDTIKHLDTYYIILEYCDSGSLEDILKKPIKEKYVQYYFFQIKNGLKYLEKHGILHRDIKPKNILLTNSKKVLKIADFGFSVEDNSDKLHETICGSPMYMAPEIMNRGNYNNQVDLWSLGVILYQMIYGMHPFGNCKNMGELKRSLDKDVDIPPVKSGIVVSKQVQELLRKMLRRNVSDRINWKDFFEHPWLMIFNGDTLKEQQKESPKNYLLSTSPKLEIEIIDDYFSMIGDIGGKDSFVGSQGSSFAESSVEPIFEIELDEKDKVIFKKLG